jgi:peptidoglycan-N-acetylglucosamine deacetylase
MVSPLNMNEALPDGLPQDDIKARKPIGSLSVDLDNKWSYMKIHGDRGWESLPCYLDVLVPRVLEFLKARDLTATFFIVGQDAALKKNHAILRSIANAGHEIGNHSFHHEPWMHLYSPAQIETEIAVADEHIERATGQKPLGFRGPGYSISPVALQELVRRGYRYDASTFPNLLTPLARAYYLISAQFTPDQRHQWQAAGGTLRDSLRPVKPYRWRMDNGTLIEIPVTTVPVLRIPIHLSYLMCLRVLSPALALRYFDAALKVCRLTRTQPSLLLHPTDFLGCDDTKDLTFIPGMNSPSEQKMEFVGEVLRRLSGEFTVVTLHQHACLAAKVADLRVVEPSFEQAH